MRASEFEHFSPAGKDVPPNSVCSQRCLGRSQMPFWSVTRGPAGVKRGRCRSVLGWGTARGAWYRRWGPDGRTYGRASARTPCVRCAGNGRADTADATAAILQWLRRRACRLGGSGSTPGGGILDVSTPVQGPLTRGQVSAGGGLTPVPPNTVCSQRRLGRWQMPFWSVASGPTGVKRGRGRLVMGWGTARVAWYRRWAADGRTYGRASARPHCVRCARNGWAATADATAAIRQW